MESNVRFLVRFLLTTIMLRTVLSQCNEAVCGSIVSKCLLTHSCDCDFEKDCSCCKECASCLSSLYSECCSCVGMCPKANDTNSELSKQSHVQDLPANFDSLFQALTEGPDAQDRWTSFVYPVDFNFIMAPKTITKYHMQSVEQDVISTKSKISTLNCTVAFLSNCMSWEKCKDHCSTMGASSMRWFHDGCCECVGESCINYGINESRCIKCSAHGFVNDEEDTIPDDIDYGDELDYDIEDD